MQTTELLDPAWKESRNRHLLMKMLKLEEPTITAKVCFAHHFCKFFFSLDIFS